MSYNLFFSYRTHDQKETEELKTALKDRLPNLPFEDLASRIPFQDDWKTHARSLLEECILVICVVGRETYLSEPVAWEIGEARRLGKPVLATKVNENVELPSICNEHSIVIQPWNIPSLASQIVEAMVPKTLFGHQEIGDQGRPQDMIWNQYNLMVQSSELLVSRRQTVNSLYLSASFALLAGIGVLVSSVSAITIKWASSGGIFLGLVGIALAYNWKRTLQSYGLLNKAKFQVIGALENLMPAKLFDAEWKVLEAKRYKSTTSMDQQTANFIAYLFLLIVILGIIAISVSW